MQSEWFSSQAPRFVVEAVWAIPGANATLHVYPEDWDIMGTQSVIVASVWIGFFLGAAQAIPFTDQATGLSVDPPAPFVTAGAPMPDGSMGIKVGSASGIPDGLGMGDDYGCMIMFKPSQEMAGQSQEEINAAVKTPGLHKQIKSALSAAFDLGEPEMFSTFGIGGVAFAGKIKDGAKQVGVALYTADMYTPKGTTVMMCFVNSGYASTAMPQFRAIRDTIRPVR